MNPFRPLRAGATTAHALALLLALGGVTAPAERLAPAHAQGFDIQAVEGGLRVTVLRAAPGSTQRHVYLLVPREAPLPRSTDADLVIRTPVRRAIVLSTTYLPELDIVGGMDTLVGVERTAFVSTPSARERLRTGAAVEVGDGNAVDAEAVIGLAPDIVFSYVLDDSRQNSHARLRRAGIPVVLSGSYLEETPLARMEWIRFTAAFYGEAARAAAAAHVERVAAAYEALAGRAATATPRPAVLMNAPFKGDWHVPGGRSYAARLVADAGGAYLWADDTRTSGVAVPFEAVFARAAEAEVWINTSNWRSRADGLREDRRFDLFRPFRTGRVYNGNARLNPEGWNDLFETGVAWPDQVLADLVHIFHPGLLPDHALRWYRPLD